MTRDIRIAIVIIHIKCIVLDHIIMPPTGSYKIYPSESVCGYVLMVFTSCSDSDILDFFNNMKNMQNQFDEQKKENC
jgi:K+-sensing histidine kinase KdpD